MSDEVKKDDGTTVVTDSKGRVLKIKEPDFLQESRINRLVGDSSTNVGYMCGYVLPAIHVVEIDGNPVPFPTNNLQLEALIGRLGREGRDAVAKYFEAREKENSNHEEQVKN